MNAAIHCLLLLLACAAMCSASTFPCCRCIKTSRRVTPSLIADVKVYEPRPYCSKREVIVVLTDGSSRCLDPKERFTQAVVQTIQMQRAAAAAKMKTSSWRTTTAPATAAPMSS